MSPISESDSVSMSAHRRLANFAIQVSDLAIFCLVLMYVVHYQSEEVGHVRIYPTWELLEWIFSSLIVWHLALANANVYQSHRLSRGFPAIEILNGVSIGAIGVGAMALMFQPVAISLNVIVHVWWISVLVIVVVRSLLWRVLVSLRKNGRNLRFALVIGSSSRVAELLKEIYDPSTGIRVVGYIDQAELAESSRLTGVEYLGNLEILPQILAKRIIDEVFIGLPVRSHYDSTARAIRFCEEQGIQVRMPCDLFDAGICFQRVDVIDRTPILSFVPSVAPYWYLIVKRLIDIVVSATLLIALIPLFVVVATLIKLDSAGAVFFVQERVGMNKRLFQLFKFRTMQADSEAMQAALEHLNEVEGAAFKIRNDPRVTALGRSLRRWSIDEIPQLINVFLGEMSLVGPRPLPSRDVERFELDWQRRRFSARPGITCLWQVSGRSSIQFKEWMELDMQYIDQRSLLLDLKILLRTIPAVLTRQGAY